MCVQLVDKTVDLPELCSVWLCETVSIPCPPVSRCVSGAGPALPANKLLVLVL